MTNNERIAMYPWENTIIGLARLAFRKHHINDEDCWYSCPASGESCNSEQMEETGDSCRCGADSYNKIVKDTFYECYREHGITDESLVDSRWNLMIGEEQL